MMSPVSTFVTFSGEHHRGPSIVRHLATSIWQDAQETRVVELHFNSLSESHCHKTQRQRLLSL